MRITCVIHSLSGGGAERVMAGLVSDFSGRGHTVCLITLDDGQHDRHDVPEGIQRICLSRSGNSGNIVQAILSNLKRIACLRRAIRNSRPDVVLSFCDRTNVLTLLATGLTKLPVVVSERSDPAQQRLGPFWGLLRRIQYRRASRLIALTATSADHMRRWHRLPVAIIPSAVTAPRSESTLQAPIVKPSATSVILGVGRLSHEKGWDRLITAFGKIASRHPAWHVWIAGDGDQYDSLQQQIEALGLASRIKLLGWVRPVAPLYAQADLFALPSRYEGFPSALLEAMAAGVASLAIDCDSGPREIIRHDVDGWLSTVQDFSTDLEKLIQSACLRNRLADAAPDVVLRFSWENMVDRFEALLLQASR